MVKLFYEYYGRKYWAPALSFTYFIFLLFILVNIFLPLVVSVISLKFWSKNEELYVQPQVNVSKEITIYAIPSDGTPPYRFSSGYLNPKYTYSTSDYTPISFSSVYKDINTDGINDKIEVSILIPIDSSITFNNINAVIGITYYIEPEIKTVLNSAIFIQSYCNTGIRKVHAIGKLLLEQDSTLPSSTTVHSDNSTFYGKFDPDFFSLLNEYKLRKNKVKFENYMQTMSYWRTNQIEIYLEIYIPNLQKVAYVPSIPYILKMAWMKYFSLVYPCYLFIFGIFAFILKHGVLSSRVYEQVYIPPN